MAEAEQGLFEAIADSAYGIEAWFDTRGRLVWVNRSVERVTGYTPAEALASRELIELMVYYKDRKYLAEQVALALRGKTNGSAEARLQHKDGGIVWVALNWDEFRCAGELRGVRLSCIETQARKEAELKLLETVAELRRAQALKDFYLTRSNEERARLEALLHVMEIGVLFMDRDHRVLFCNRPFRRIWGLDEREELTGVREAVLFSRTAGLRNDDRAYRRHVIKVLGETGISAPYEVELRDGRVISQVSAPVPGTTPGEFIGRVWIYEDVTERRRVAQHLVRLAERDPLTNLFNRRRFLEDLERTIADASRRHTRVGLVAIDLDGFKPINDSFGHQAGDTVLMEISHRVGAIVRRNETFYRVGGDEFSILAPDSSEADLVRLAGRVCSTVGELRFSFEGQSASLTASVGIALYPDHAANAEEIIARGDQAMYEAKTHGKNAFRVCTRGGAGAYDRR